MHPHTSSSTGMPRAGAGDDAPVLKAAPRHTGLRIGPFLFPPARLQQMEEQLQAADMAPEEACLFSDCCLGALTDALAAAFSCVTCGWQEEGLRAGRFYGGVQWHDRKHAWQAQVFVGGCQVQVGVFHNDLHAAITYDLLALKLRGPSALLNFPVSNYYSEIEAMDKMSIDHLIRTLQGTPPRAQYQPPRLTDCPAHTPPFSQPHAATPATSLYASHPWLQPAVAPTQPAAKPSNHHCNKLHDTTNAPDSKTAASHRLPPTPLPRPPHPPFIRQELPHPSTAHPPAHHAAAFTPSMCPRTLQPFAEHARPLTTTSFPPTASAPTQPSKAMQPSSPAPKLLLPPSTSQGPPAPHQPQSARDPSPQTPRRVPPQHHNRPPARPAALKTHSSLPRLQTPPQAATEPLRAHVKRLVSSPTAVAPTAAPPYPPPCKLQPFSPTANAAPPSAPPCKLQPFSPTSAAAPPYPPPYKLQPFSPTATAARQFRLPIGARRRSMTRPVLQSEAGHRSQPRHVHGRSASTRGSDLLRALLTDSD